MPRPRAFPRRQGAGVDLGVPASRTAFVNLYINDELLGLYTAVEPVDDMFVKANFEQAGFTVIIEFGWDGFGLFGHYFLQLQDVLA